MFFRVLGTQRMCDGLRVCQRSRVIRPDHGINPDNPAGLFLQPEPARHICRSKKPSRDSSRKGQGYGLCRGRHSGGNDSGRSGDRLLFTGALCDEGRATLTPSPGHFGF